MPKRLVLLVGVAIAIALSAGGLAISNSSGRSSGGATVDVTGSATVEAGPDTLTVELTVQVDNAVERAALAKADEEMQHLQKTFVEADVPTKDLVTSDLSVGQNYGTNGRADGYQASEELTATLHDLAHAGKLLAAAQAAVGNDVSINDTSYSLTNENAVLSTARAEAVRHARAAAAAIAHAAGVSLGGVVRITDQTSTTTPISFGSVAPERATSSGSGSVPLQAGTQPVVANVEIVYGLN